MIGRSIGIATTVCALGASALLIPPGVAPATHSDGTFPLVVDPNNRYLTLPCPGCVFPSKQPNVADVSDDLFWIQGGANSIILNFSVSDDGQRLQLGGQDFYGAGDDMTRRLRVQQIPSTASVAELEAGQVNAATLEITSGEATTRRHVPTDDDAGHTQLTQTDFTIKTLEGQQVELDRVTVTTLRLSDATVLIVHVEALSTQSHEMEMMPVDDEDSPPFHSRRPESVDKMTPPQHGGPHGLGHDAKGMPKDCGSLPAALCRFKHAFEAKVFGMGKAGKKPCPGRKGQHINPWKGKDGRVRLPSHIKGPKFHTRPDGKSDGPHHGRPHHGRPHHMHSHQDGHHRHHQHSFLHAFANGFVAVLVPVMAGITIGMAVSFIGMVFGRLISFLWIRFVRGGRRGYASVALVDNTAEQVDFRNAEIVEMEAPPMYEHAPKYEDVEKFEVREEK